VGNVTHQHGILFFQGWQELRKFLKTRTGGQQFYVSFDTHVSPGLTLACCCSAYNHLAVLYNESVTFS